MCRGAMKIHVMKAEDIEGLNGIYKAIAQLTSILDEVLFYSQGTEAENEARY
jgi:hypothetical protein